MQKDVAVTIFGRWVNEQYPGCGVACIKSVEFDWGWRFYCISPLGVYDIKNDGTVEKLERGFYL